jgi:hypothetical protein
MVWLTSLDDDCCGDCLESCSIFFRLEEYGTIFCAMVAFTAIEHAIWRPECVQASAWHIASLTVLSVPLVEGCLIPFLWRWSKILFPVLWWLATIRIDDVHRFGVIAFIIIIARPCSIVLLWCFPLVLKLAEMLDL